MPTHSAWVFTRLEFAPQTRAERTLIQKDQLASRSRQRCLRSGSHRHCCVSQAISRVRNLITISSSRCQTTRTPRRTTKRANYFLRTNLEPPAQRWWSQTGSNRRPPACKAGALPTELWPRTVAATRTVSGIRWCGGPGKT